MSIRKTELHAKIALKSPSHVTQLIQQIAANYFHIINASNDESKEKMEQKFMVIQLHIVFNWHALRATSFYCMRHWTQSDLSRAFNRSINWN